MARTVETRGGVPILGRNGRFRRKYNVSAPNDKSFGIIQAELRATDSTDRGTFYVRISQVPVGVTQAALYVYYLQDGVGVSYKLPAVTLVTNTWMAFGSPEVLLTPDDNSLVLGLMPVVNSLEGRPTKIRNFTRTYVEIGLPTILTAPMFTSQLKEGEVFTITPGTVRDTTANSTLTIVYERADDSAGTNSASESISNLTMNGDAGLKYFRIGLKLEDPLLEEPAYMWSTWVFCADTAVAIALGASPAFTSTLQEGIAFTKNDGTVINSTVDTTVTISYEHVDVTVGESPTVLTPTGLVLPTTVKNYARIKRRVQDVPLSFDQTDYSLWTAVTKLPTFDDVPAFTSSLTEATAFTKRSAGTLYATASTVVTTTYLQNSTAVDGGAVALSIPGNTMPGTVDNFVQIVETMTDPKLTEAGVTRQVKSAWTACANAPAVAPPIPVPTFGATTLLYSGTDSYFYPIVASFTNHVAGDQYEWTTSLLVPIPDNQIEFMTTVTGGYRTQMDDVAARVNPNSQAVGARTDYSCFRFTGGNPYVLDEVRGERVRFRRRRLLSSNPDTYGPWSEFSEQYKVPVPASVIPTTGWQKRWIPLVTRAFEGYEAKIIDGPGLQFLRSFATTPADPALLLGAMDQNFPWQSNDFGETFFTPAWTGLWGGREGISVWIDPTDALRQICAYCVQVPIEVQRPLAGLYLSKDGGQTCTQVLSVPLTRGAQNIRHNMQHVVNAPGGTPATRTIYYMQVAGSETSRDVQTIQLWRSTDGGDTWFKRGSTLSVATFANAHQGPWGLAVAPNGNLYQYGIMGAWRSTDGGSSWTKCTGLPSGACNQLIAAANNNVWAACNNGLYKSTDGLAFSKNTPFANVVLNNQGLTYPNAIVRTFGISPADNNYMVAVKSGENYPHPIYSTNGGTSWTRGVAHERLGQDANAHTLGSNDHYGIVPHVSNREKWFFHMGQHFGVSTDHGQNVYAAGFFFDGAHTRGNIGFHPTNWQRFVFAQQDRATMTTQTAGDYWLEDDIGSPSTGKGAQIAAAVNDSTYISGAGAVMTSTNRVLFHAGQAAGKRVAVLFDQTVPANPLTTKGTIGGTLVTSWVSALTDNAALDPYDGTKCYGGQYRYENLNAAQLSGVTAVNITRFFVGLSAAGGATTIYGVENAGSANRNIYRSTNRGSSWTLWRTATGDFRPSDNRPAICPCPHSNSRVYAASGARLARISGATNPTETIIFDCRDYLPTGHPAYIVHSVAVDFFNENLGYVSLFMWGVPCVFRSQNLLAATPTWESIAVGDDDGLPHLDLELYVHPLTSDLFAVGSHGTFVCKPPTGHNTTYGITNSVWDRIDAYLKTTQ